MRQFAALGFVAIASIALVARLWQQAAPLQPLAGFYDYVPNYRTPLLVQTPKHSFDYLSMVESAVRAEPAARVEPAERQVSILLAGDTGLNGSFQPVHAGFEYQRRQPLEVAA